MLPVVSRHRVVGQRSLVGLTVAEHQLDSEGPYPRSVVQQNPPRTAGIATIFKD